MAINSFSSMINMQQQMMMQQQQMQAYSQGYGGTTFPGSIGSSNPTGFQGNIADAHVGGNQVNWRGGLLPSFQPNEGYALDFNRNGRYDRGRDGVLVFDLNRDGKYDKKDVQYTNNMMQSATGNFDFNNDGKISFGERIQGNALRGKYQQLDRNRDGVLSQQEMSAGGGRVWVDSSRGGGISSNELHSVNSVPNGGVFGGRRQEVDFVNPFTRTSHTSNQGSFPGFQQPWGGGGSWGGSPWGGGGMGWGGAPSYPMNGFGSY